ncbi:PREDICTED: SHC SH2 domain-binding protein 1 [Polistes dominula]|uniref:SHC SH2 domain-binding protein 1 n=1 Tax=Polistes dominula TaxID=743375 RepID=A0ABM1IRA0_POLDO|nr:PREDICTED: SHC SH2 domain-binding protein 1 [Polistes dominula]XP_015182737.1 PREDICTED: SHC SH2 domain-binding protein 1 [Polistes dominula]
MEIYTFDKCLQERLIEFSEILSSRGETVSASQVKLEWLNYVELVIEPTGWQALWKIPRLTCQEFKIHYPTIVVVQTEQVDFNDLSALVKIIAVQDEIHLPAKYDVPLIELYPTKSQPNNTLDMIGTSCCIDQLRFFYNYLWMPWDIDDDENSDWVTLHLESRIRLFFDMKRGCVNKDTCDVIRTLTREGREIQHRISKLEEAMSDEDESENCLLDDGKACQLMNLHFRLQQIKTEMEVLENPAIRDIISRNQKSVMVEEQTKKSEDKDRKKEAHFVWLGSTLTELKNALSQIETIFSSDLFFKIYGCLQEALLAAEKNDIVVVGEGLHQIRGSGSLEEGGTIKGIGKSENIILSANDIESLPSLLDFSGQEVLLENISINLGELQAGIIVRKQCVRMVGCKIYASNQSIIKLGVVVLPGAKLIMEKTVFDGLGTAVVIYGKGEVNMSECSFQNCSEGIQLHDDATLMATKCQLECFKEYAIRMETQKYLSNLESKVGSIELLENVKEISLEECTFQNNLKADILLKSRLSTAFVSREGFHNIVSS